MAPRQIEVDSPSHAQLLDAHTANASVTVSTAIFPAESAYESIWVEDITYMIRLDFFQGVFPHPFLVFSNLGGRSGGDHIFS